MGDEVDKSVTAAAAALPTRNVTDEGAVEHRLCLDTIRDDARRLGYATVYERESYGNTTVFVTRRDDKARCRCNVQIYLVTAVISVCIMADDCDDQGEDGADSGGVKFSRARKVIYFVRDTTDDTARNILDNPWRYAKPENDARTRREVKDEWREVTPADELTACSTCEESVAETSDGEGAGCKPRLLACARCWSVAYCHRRCQREHWRSGGHREACASRPSGRPRSECDSARRWRHVAHAVGLSSLPLEVDQIAQFCSLFDRLCFEPGEPPCLCSGRYGCGAICFLSNVLLDVAREYHGVVGFCHMGDAMKKFQGELETVDQWTSQFPVCAHADDYSAEFGKEIKGLREALEAFRPEVRSELIMWLFERIRCNEKLVMIDAEEEMLFSDRTFPIHMAHSDFSQLVHTSGEQKIMCATHGTFHSPHYQSDGEEAEEEGDDVTEATEGESESDED